MDVFQLKLNASLYFYHRCSYLESSYLEVNDFNERSSGSSVETVEVNATRDRFEFTWKSSKSVVPDIASQYQTFRLPLSAYFRTFHGKNDRTMMFSVARDDIGTVTLKFLCSP